MTLTCVQAKMGVFSWRARAQECVRVRGCARAKEKGVQYERVARANRAMDSAPA